MVFMNGINISSNFDFQGCCEIWKGGVRTIHRNMGTKLSKVRKLLLVLYTITIHGLLI